MPRHAVSAASFFSDSPEIRPRLPGTGTKRPDLHTGHGITGVAYQGPVMTTFVTPALSAAGIRPPLQEDKVGQMG
ncbi:hypothetical protein JMJ77_0005327 [Colletotrichum scovillei]|uniref:Uncharacterized protein n=1 Tax=Colletotrichum scovillei TaxID=1209932 RepID=A0A9P7RGH9_9PEZI|nr:hypothetical protein JMJ77_0005327 [Colletotrichum scovillei]KAG7076543.1 hypothetical protein JMJ76_0013806 [Colletotrichum scovillei]KAG7083618.1 hypothetical protein JMJ78_0009063 [Colletotrichum scovillei]